MFKERINNMVSIFDRFKKKDDQSAQVAPVSPVTEVDKKKVAAPPAAKKPEVPSVKKSAPASPAGKKPLLGRTKQSHRILLRPLVTEKAADLATVGKYVFMVAPGMNKVEIAKAIRSVYGVDPVNVNVINNLGKMVRYGRSYGRRKNWRKAVVTLKAGDKIEIYEGV
jgi:large subunit ribosomal protein L23